MSDLIAKYSDDAYEFHTADGNASILMENLRVDRNGGVNAETTVRWHVRPHDGLLKSSSLNLLADRSIKSWANELEDRAEYDWYAALTAAAKLAKDRYRQGDPPIILADVDPTERQPWFVEPFIQHGGPTVIAADGGTGKSLFALAFAAMVASGHSKLLNITAPKQPVPVLYLDWETDRYMHRDRLGAICQAANIDLPRGIHYRREYAPLAETGTELAKHVASIGAGLVVVDSKGAALSGAPEDAEATIRLFRACRQMAVPVLVIDHITNEAADRGGAKRPFGSRYSRNLARNVWMMEKGSGDTPGQIAVSMRLTKSNDGQEGLRRSWVVYIDRDTDGRYKRIEFQHTDNHAVVALAAAKTDDDRIERVLRDAEGPMTVADLAAATGVKEATVKTLLNRFPERFVNVNHKSPGVAGLWTISIRQAGQEDLPAPY